MKKQINIKGHRFSRLVAVKFIEERKGHYYWECVCDCGKTKVVEKGKLMNGETRSCACLRAKKTRERSVTHGMFNTLFYKVYRAMRNRCTNPKVHNYNAYGGRGISVCERWQKFENFRDDMLESYNKHREDFGPRNTTLDRTDVHGNYNPDNCCWATHKEQANNRQNSPKNI